MLYYAKGIEVNYRDAIKYYKIENEKGNTDATLSYAHMPENEKGIKIHNIDAIKYEKISSSCDIEISKSP